MEKFALFDFDGTLAKGDSILSFLGYSFKKKLVGLKGIGKGLWAYAGYSFGKVSDTAAKEKAMAFIAGKTQEEMTVFCEDWVEKKLSKKLFTQGIEELRDLAEKGYKILLITASPDFYLDPLLKRLPITDIIGTRMDKNEEGVFSGRISGNNCRGIEKNLRLAEYLAAKGWQLSTLESYGYGNSGYDEAMLTLVANPVLVNPSKSLQKAFPKGRVVNWKKTEKEA